MTHLDTLFFEQYKQLDTLFCNMLKTDKGVTAYIAAMEGVSQRDRAKVAGFEEDYRALKQLRWVRNQIAHNVETALDGFCRPEDLTALKGMHKRVTEQNDPLSVLYRIKTEQKNKKRLTDINAQNEEGEDKGIFQNPFVAIGLFALLILAIIIIAKLG